MKQNTQSGNAIVIILIAIALFAALGVAFSNTSRTSSSFLSDEEAKAYANQIIAYGNDVKSAVKRLQLRGCSDTEISFENNIESGYENPNAPTNKSCHVFDIAGGGFNWISIPTNILESDHDTYNAYGQSFIANTIQVVGSGTSCSTGDCTELVFQVPHIKPEICAQTNASTVNNKTNAFNESVTNHLYQNNRKFIGVYDFQNISSTSTIGDDFFPPNTKNGCIFRGGGVAIGHPYTYFQVLIAR